MFAKLQTGLLLSSYTSSRLQEPGATLVRILGIMRKQIFLFLGVVLAASSSWAQSADAQPSPIIVGTWFGSIVLTNVDGRISHDNAVLVVEKVRSDFNGSMGRTIDQMTLWSNGKFNNGQLMFHLDAASGLNISLAIAGGRLGGTATGQGVKARIDLRPAPGLLPHQQLQQEIASVDRQLYEAFENCDVARYASFLSRNLEFYQDHTGMTGYEEI